MKKIGWIIVVVILVTVITSATIVVVYCNKCFSTDRLTTFSTFYNGMLMPLLTVVNIIVLIWLTITVDQNDSGRSEKNILYQKRSALMQLRKEEIMELSKVLTDSLDLKPSTNILEMSRPIIFATTYLETFANTKLKLFSLSEDSDTTKKIIQLHKEYKGLHAILNNGGNISNKQIEVILTLKNTIINNLQDIMLNEHCVN